MTTVILHHETKLGNTLNNTFFASLLSVQYGFKTVVPALWRAHEYFENFRGENCAGYVQRHGEPSVRRAFLTGIDGIGAFDQVRDAAQRGTESLEEAFELLCRRYRVSSPKQAHVAEIEPGRVLFIGADNTGQLDLTEEMLTRMTTYEVVVIDQAHYFTPPRYAVARIENFDAIHRVFTPSAKAKKIDLAKLQALKARNNVVIGVHMRKTDYATYLNGQFFYGDEQYAAICRKFVDSMPDKQVGFLFFTDGEIDHAAFAGLDFDLNDGDTFSDFFTMAECDGVLGPVSSFGNWASLINKRPRFVIRGVEDFLNTPLTTAGILGTRSFPVVG